MGSIIKLFIILTTILLLNNISTSKNTAFAQDLAIHHPNHPKLIKFRINDQQLNDDQDDGGKEPVMRVGKTYVVALKIGKDPSTEVYLDFDTRSQFTWVQHSSCEPCVAPRDPITGQYNGSSTLRSIPCQATTDCIYPFDVPGLGCGNDLCTYNLTYADGTSSSGKLGIESILTFTKRETALVFGVGVDNTCRPNAMSCFQGVSGFGAGPLTMPSQLLLKVWGFCLPINASMDGLFFEGGDRLSANYTSTRIYHEDGSSYYVANLTSLYVYGAEDPILAPNNTMVVVDTGTTLTHLQPFLFDNIMDSIKKSIDSEYNDSSIEPPQGSEFQLCYEFPYHVEISIQLGEELFITIGDPESFWISFTETLYCVALLKSQEELNIVGNMYTRGYMIVYDITNVDHMFLNVSYLYEEQGRACLTPV